MARNANNIVALVIASCTDVLPFQRAARTQTAGCDTRTFNSNGFTSVESVDTLVIDGHNVNSEGVQALLRMAGCIIVTLSKALQQPPSPGVDAARNALGIIREATETIPTDPAVMEALKTDLESDRVNSVKKALEGVDMDTLRAILAQNDASGHTANR